MKLAAERAMFGGNGAQVSPLSNRKCKTMNERIMGRCARASMRTHRGCRHRHERLLFFHNGTTVVFPPTPECVITASDQKSRYKKQLGTTEFHLLSSSFFPAEKQTILSNHAVNLKHKAHIYPEATRDLLQCNFLHCLY